MCKFVMELIPCMRKFNNKCKVILGYELLCGKVMTCRVELWNACMEVYQKLIYFSWFTEGRVKVQAVCYM